MDILEDDWTGACRSRLEAPGSARVLHPTDGPDEKAMLNTTMNTASAGRRSVTFQNPGGPVRIILPQLFIFISAQIGGEHNPRSIRIGRVVNPFIKEVPWPVANKYQLLPWACAKRALTAARPWRSP